MTRDQAVLLALGALALLCVGLVVSAVLARRNLARELSLAHAELGDLRARVDELESVTVPPAGVLPTEYLITGLGQASADPETSLPPVDRAAFADAVLRETVVKTASLAHGLRRGLAPASRNRIRFEMKQEVRRSRKQRRADLRAATRDRHTRQRSRLAEDAS